MLNKVLLCLILGKQERCSNHEQPSLKSENAKCDDMDDILDSLAGFYEDHAS